MATNTIPPPDGEAQDQEPPASQSLYLHVPLTEPRPCRACRKPCEPGVDHGCTGRPAPEVSR
jgi:hypothetical protein